MAVKFHCVVAENVKTFLNTTEPAPEPNRLDVRYTASQGEKLQYIECREITKTINGQKVRWTVLVFQAADKHTAVCLSLRRVYIDHEPKFGEVVCVRAILNRNYILS